MSYNPFKIIRNSSVTVTILTGLLSNVIVFAQPIEQLYANSNLKYRPIVNNESTYFLEEPNPNNWSENEVLMNTNAKNIETNTIGSNVKNGYSFEAIEKEAVIGTTATGKENPRDNFFSIYLPTDINLDEYKIIMAYDLYGLESAEHTSKAINDHKVYGGQLIKINDSWSSVVEEVPSHFITVGRNDIFFNRRAEKDYHYKIKNLRFELTKKMFDEKPLLNTTYHNYNGRLHLLGHVPIDVKTIEVYGETIAVYDGVYEGIIANVEMDLDFMDVIYELNNRKFKIKNDVVYHSDNANFEFYEEIENTKNNVVLTAISNQIEFESLSLNFNELDSESKTNNVEIIGLDFKSLKPLNSDLENVTFGSYLGYRTKLSNLNDNVVTKMHLKYDPSIIPDGYSYKDVRIFSFDKIKREWVALPVDSLDYDKHIIISPYDGDTDYINGVIKVPEMAETSSFTPTTISDMEYADPSSGVVSIAPPSPNNNGTATTSFPVKLPQGRNGMMPNIGLNYSSGGGNGWTGLGWDLQLPAITIDTRWGTPRFDSNYESEIYQLNGQTLVYKVGSEYTNPHRNSSDIQRASNRIFYLRKEGSYLKIKRLGGSPSTYSWEVTDKQGNKSIYGSTEDSRVKQTVSGNAVTLWALKKTIDPFGNYVEYEYDKGTVDQNDINGVANAQFFYPKSIKYTLKGTSNTHYYQVDFERNSYSVGQTQNPSARVDIILNARSGAMLATTDLLTEIKVYYYDGNLNPIRTYQLEYNEAPFNKQQLSKISEYDTSGQLFYSNSLEYFDEIGNNQLIDTNPTNWNGEEESVSTFGGISSDGSALGTGTSNGFSAGLRTGVGIGFNPTSVSATIGGSYNYSQSKEETKISFMDVNGDGLPDKVFKDGNDVRYRPNLGIGNGFGDALYFGINDLDETKSRTNTFGYDANIGVSDFGVGVGRSHSRTRTETGGYFTDFNGDGMLDIISGSVVRFNTTSPWEDNEHPTISFNTNSALSVNTIYTGQVNPSIIPDLELETLDQLRSDHPQFDHVKAWQAPYTGTISIQSLANLITYNTCDSEGYQNSFRLTIEKAGQNQGNGLTQLISIGGANEWELNALTQTQTINTSGISISKGETLFFRVHNREYGCGGEIEWNPEINYMNTSGSVFNTEDEHEKNIFEFDAKDDFIINNGGTWAPTQEDTSITFNANFGVDAINSQNLGLSDDVRFIVKKIRYEHENNTTLDTYGQIIDNNPDPYEEGEIYTRIITLRTNGTIGVNIDCPSCVSENTIRSISNQFINGGTNDKYSYVYQFYAESDSNVQWNLIDWKPIITNQNGIIYYPPISYTIYNDNINETNYKFTTNLVTTPTINIDPNIPDDEDTEVLRISHNMFSPSDFYQYFIEPYDNNEFPIKINWVVKVKDNNGTRPLHKAIFYLHRGECHDLWPFGSDYCEYEFRTPSGVVIDPSLISHESYFAYDLSKQDIIDINAESGEIYAQFYIENPRFGLDNPANITIQVHPDQQANYSFSPNTLQKPFATYRTTFLGNTYRSWGQFLYNGGVKYDYNEDGTILGFDPNSDDMETFPPHHYFDGNIDMSVFNVDNADTETEPDPNAVVRYILYSQDNQNDRFDNSTLISNTTGSGQRLSVRYGSTINSELSCFLGRFAESNIHDLYLSDTELGLDGGTSGTSGFVGLKQRSFSLGRSDNGQVNVGGTGVSGTASEGNSKVLNQYIDINGDRYPDMITKSNIQVTSMRGGLSDLNLPNNFVSGAENKDNTQGVTISGVLPNSTASDNASTNSPTITNVNSGINTSEGETFNSRQWADVNGDGLTDQITISKTEVKVRLNIGYNFSDEVVWSNGINFSDLNVSTRNNSSVSGGFGNASFAAGIGTSSSSSLLNASLVDVNSDGLPDLLIRTSSGYNFYLNNGVQFEQNASQIFYNNDVDLNRSITANIYGSVTGGFWFPVFYAPPTPLFFPVKVTATPTVGANGGINEKLITIQDIDGDGYPDVLEDGVNNGSIRAHLNKIGKTHLIKKVNLPLGGSWEVDYEREGNTYKLPQNKWVMSEIRTNDGFDGDNSFSADETLTTMVYENPNHDRREREFLGFGIVKVFQNNPLDEQPYRYSQVEYHNENIYLKGLQKRTALYDANDEVNPLSENITVYNIMDADNPITNLFPNEANQFIQSSLSLEVLDYDRLFVAPVKTISTTYEGTNGLSLEQQFTAYDTFGNLKAYKNLGDTYTDSAPNDAYTTSIEYYTDSQINGIQNATGFVKKVSVYQVNGNTSLLREREAQYTAQGRLSKVITKLNTENETNEVELFYDTYGNIERSKLQNNFETIIGYDNLVHTFPTSVSNSLNEQSQSVYNYLFGIPIYKTDINGKIMVTRIDNRGRLIEVISPNEMNENNGNNWTIRMQYPNENTTLPAFQGLDDFMLQASGSFDAEDFTGGTPAKHYAVTNHNVKDYNQGNFDVLTTVSLVDGLGKAIQLKKTQFSNNQLKWLISGKEKKDVYGRILESYLPTTKPLSYSISSYDNSQSAIAPPTLMTYDVRDRVLSVKQPGETQTSNTIYSISEGMLLINVINELGQAFDTYIDVRGRQRKSVQNGELTTQFYYNAIGEKVKVRNNQGYDTFYKYDLAGRRIEERHPDYGLQVFKYNNLGNLIERFNSNLLVEGNEAGIRYEYDQKNRLTQIKYPINIENNVEYTYGLPTDANAVSQNAVGRLYTQSDASGVQGFAYDDLGNLSDHLRGVAVAGRHTFWYRTRWTYDSFNRLQKIIYPDDEVVKYNYNNGGTLSSVTRTLGTLAVDDPIVSGIFYNDFGERTQITYGNGTSTSYTYDDRRRLGDLSHNFNSFAITNQYEYDALSNVTSLNTLQPQNTLPGASQLGGPVNHAYGYDNYNRLISASGSYVGPNDLGTDLLKQEYSLTMEYDLAHNITKKHQTHVQGSISNYGDAIATPEIMIKTNYQLVYDDYATGANVVNGPLGEYGYVQPHAPRTIIETPDDVELNPTNPKYKKQEIEYDANGNQLSVARVVNDGEQLPAYEGLVEQQRMILYKNLWDEEDRLRAVDLNPEESSAHQLAVYTYDAGGQRTVRYVPGRLDIKSNAKNVSNNERDEVMLYPNGLITAKATSKPGNVPEENSLVSTYTKHYYIGGERVNSRLGSTKDLGLYPDKIENLFIGLRPIANATVSGANTALANTYTSMGQSISLSQVQESDKRGLFTHDANTNDAYWYHSDRLGSSSYISNQDGYVTQHIEYLPYGETLVDEHQNSYNTPYKFNGKELDEETGNYYYGARYYNPKFSMWLSVDPLREEMPSWSGYNYTFSNPINLVDPDGLKPGYPHDHKVSKKIINYNLYIWYAFEGSNNTSTIHFHEHAKGLAGSDARNKAVGAIGEGIFATRLISKPAMSSELFIGHSFKGFHHDLFQKTTLTSYNAFGFELKVNYTDQDGNAKSQMVTVLGDKRKRKMSFGVGTISYEVKTNSSKSSVSNIFKSFKKGVSQVIDRAGVADASVLVFDFDAFQQIRDLPETQELINNLESVKNQHDERKVFLNLEKDLSKESTRAYYDLKEKIKG